MYGDDKPEEWQMRLLADNPASNGFTPVGPKTLRRWADETERLRNRLIALTRAWPASVAMPTDYLLPASPSTSGQPRASSEGVGA